MIEYSRLVMVGFGMIVLVHIGLYSNSEAQLAEPILPSNLGNVGNNAFRVGITIFGVDSDTGMVFSFVKVNNSTGIKIINTTREEMSYPDGVSESIFSFANQTIQNGTGYTACILVVYTGKYLCDKGYNSPSPTRTEFSQFLLD
jgi:hypothetical protein